MLGLLAAATPPPTTTTIIESNGVSLGLDDFWFAIVTGLVAALIWWGITWLLRCWRLDQNFKHLAGQYRVTKKLEAEPQTYWVSIKVSGNLMTVTYEDLPEGDSVTGEIVMNEQLPRSGRGHYHHLKSGVQLWGFYDAQLTPTGTILVHKTFVLAKKDREEVQAFEWSPIARPLVGLSDHPIERWLRAQGLLP